LQQGGKNYKYFTQKPSIYLRVAGQKALYQFMPRGSPRNWACVLNLTYFKGIFMKKFLMGTTALIGAATIASAAQAAGPDVTVGGFINFQSAFSDANNAFETTASGFDRSNHFVTDTEVHINVDGKADNGLGYGAVIELEADTDAGNTDDGGSNADKAYIYLESSAGRVEAGDNVGAAQALTIGAGSIARATGGINGDFHRFVDVGQNVNGGFTAPSAIFVPGLPSTAATNNVTPDGVDLLDEEEATKLTYFTPRVSGFQAGVSYTPDTGDNGSAAGLSSEVGVDQYENLWSLGANYEGDFEGVGVKVGVTGEFGDAENPATAGASDTQDISAWQVGAELDFEGFSVAGSYGDNDDSRQLKSGTTEVSYWTLGAAYETGPYGVSVTYMDSEASATGVSDDEFTNLVVGADYSLAPGLTPYIEAAFFDAKEGGVASNDGSVILVGTQLNF
jgi:hypothetical protein